MNICKLTFFKKILLLFKILFFIISINLYAQTGPGGVGNTTGINGQPKNVLWLDASTLGFADGADLTTWNDISGNGNDLIQSNASYTPIFQNDGSNINGHPRAEFSKADNRIVLNPFNDMPTSGISSFIIYKTSDSGDGLLSYNTASRDNAYLIFDNNSLRTFINGTDNLSGNAFNSGSWQIMSHKWKSSGGDLIINQNGDQVHSATFQNGVSIPSGGSLAIGGEQDSPDGGYSAGQAFQGEIAEIVMYNSFLNSAQRLLVENYLSEKYNLSFTTSGNDKYTGNDAAYIYNIAGIGQEADGDHTQTVSGGLYLYEWNSSFTDGEYVMLGHDNTTNNSTTIRTDIEITTSGAEAAWARDYYLEKTSSDGIDVKFIFDFKEGLTDGQYPTNVADYVLLYRAGTSGNYTKVTASGSGTFDADQVYFNISDADFADGYYTIGTDDQTNSPVEGSAGRTWYALASGDWDTWDFWTLDPSGSLPNNPGNETPANIDKVVIHTGKTITISSNTKTTADIVVDGILDIGTTSGHNFTKINGSGRIRLASDNFPLGDRTDFVTAGQGEGTVVWQGGTYNLSTAQTFFKMEVDLDNSANTITMLADYTLNGDLVVETGIFQINDNTAITNLNITVNGNVSVESTGQILTGTGNARHQFDIYGNLTNNGTVKFTNRVAADYANEAVDGIVDANFLSDNSNQTVLCNGITNFYRIEIDKGSDMTYELSISASSTANFKLYGYASQGHPSVAQLVTNTNALALFRGTVRIRSNIEIPTLSTSGNYNISENAKLWVDGGTVQKNSGSAIVPYGELLISSGLLETRITNGITLRDNGSLEIQGGTVNSNQFRTSVLGATHVGSYLQSGGTANILGTNTNADYYAFNLTFPTNVFQMTGGTLHIHEAHGKGGIFINSDPANVNVTGGTLICEIDDSENFVITSRANFWNVILRNSTATGFDHILDEGVDVGSTDVYLAAQPLSVLNDLTIEEDCFLDHNGEDITIGAGFSISEDSQKQGTNNYGLLYDTAKPNNLTFNGSTSDTLYIGHNVDDGYELYVWNLNINKTNGSQIVLKGDPLKEPANVSAEWHNRLLDVKGTIDVQNGTLNQGKQSIRLYANVYVRSTGILGVYIPGTTDITAYIMLKDDNTGNTDLNTENGAELGNFKLNPGNGRLVSISSDVIIKRIGFHSGSLDLRSNNLKLNYLHRNTTTNNFSVGNGNTSKMIYSDGNASDGGISIYIPAGTTDGTTFSLPLGTDNHGIAKYTPVQIRIYNMADDGYIKINPVDTALFTLNNPSSFQLQYYWHVDYSDFTATPEVQFDMHYIDADVDGAENSYTLGRVVDPNIREEDNSGNVDRVNDILEYSQLSLLRGDYSAGRPSKFTGTVLMLYARKNGVWHDYTTWSTTRDGSSPLNNSNQLPDIGDICIIGTNTTNYAVAVYSGHADYQPIKIAKLVILRYGGGESSLISVGENGADCDFGVVTNYDPDAADPTSTINHSSKIIVSGTNIPNGDFGQFMNAPNALFTFSRAFPGSNATIDDGSGGSLSNVYYPSYKIGNTILEYPVLQFEYDGYSGGYIELPDVDITVHNDIRFWKNDHHIRFGTSVDGGDVTVENNITFYSSGTYNVEFQATGTARTLTVKGDINFNNKANSQYSVTNAASSLIHTIKIEGNVINPSGSSAFNCYNGTANASVNLEFLGLSSTVFDNMTSVPEFNQIIMNKGSDQTYTVTLNSNFSLGANTAGTYDNKPIALQNGSLILNNSTMNLDINTGNDNFQIPSTSCLEVRQGQINISGDDTGILLDGKLLISGGNVNMDDAVNNGNNYIEYSSSGNAELIISAGTLTVGSQIRRGLGTSAGILTYMQSSGTVIIGENSAPEGNRGVFEILNSGSSFTHNGGDLFLVRQQTNPTFAALYLDPEIHNLTAGTTITLGNASTLTNQEFGIYSTINLKNLTLDNSSTNNPKAKMWTVPLSIEDTLTINSGTEFNANGLDLNCYGNFTNAGTFTANENTTYFLAGTDQQIEGNTTFYNLTSQNTANLNLNSGNTDIIVENILNLESGTLNDNANGIGVYGDINNEAVHVYGGIGVEDGISLLGTSEQTMTGSGIYGKLSINNANGVVLPVGNTPIINDYLKLEAGVLNIGGNILTLAINCQIQEANPFGINNMIGTNVSFTDYGVKKYFPTGAGSFTYPIGSVSGLENKYTPIVTTFTQNSSGTAYLIVKPADEIHPTIVEDVEAPDPEITDADNMLQYYWVLQAYNFSDLAGTVEMYYHDTDVEVTAPYTVADYITAKLLNDGTGSWSKFDDVSKFDETNKKLIFDISNFTDAAISGDYTAGVDGSTFNGAIPDEVPLYASKGVLGVPDITLDWHTADTWRVDDGTGTWVLPASIGLPDIPNGSRVRIITGDRVTTSVNYIDAYTSDILGTLDVGTTFANRVGNVTGTGTLYTERGTLPAGYYEAFLTSTGGTLEFGGSTDYSVLSNITEVNNIIFSGTNKRELPNLDLIVLGDFTIDGTDITLEVINEFDTKLDLRNDVIFNVGAFDAGTGADAIVEFNGTNGVQSVSGTASFTVGNAYNHVIINNTNGIELSSPVDIEQTLTFDIGVINTDATNILKLTNTLENIVIGAGTGRFVDGPLSKNITSGQDFDFPTGNNNRYGNVSVVSSSVSDYWTAEYYNDDPINAVVPMDPSVFISPLQVVSDNEYWRVESNVAATSKVQIRWDSQSAMTTGSNRSDMRIAEWQDLATDAWVEVDPDNTISGTDSEGTILQNLNSTTFNEFGTGNFFTLSTVYIPQTLTWDGSESIVWNLPANWNNNTVPTAVDDITIPTTGVTNEPTIDVDAYCQAIDLQTSRTLTINAGKSLTATGDFTLDGTLILKSPVGEGPSASFIDNGNISGAGTMQAERYMSANEFHYVSSPIEAGGNAGSDLFTAHPSGEFNPNFYNYNEGLDIDGNPSTAPAGAFDPDNLAAGWVEAHDGGTTNVAMAVKQGYAFWTNQSQNITYIGDPNTGDMSVSGLAYTDNDAIAGSLPNYYDGWNLVGNPYPSSIDWDLIKTDRTNLDDGIYVWDGTQYASYAGGIKGGSMNLSNEVAPMQGFYVHATADNASFTLNNTHRVHSSVNYLKSGSENTVVKPNFVRLKMQANGYSDYTVIYFKSNATEGFDGVFDAFKLYSSFPAVPHIYSVTSNDQTPVSINALHDQSMDNLIVPLHIKIGQAGSYTISLDEFNFENNHVYFVDTYENNEIYLNTESLEDYSFTCDAGELSDRFELHFFKNNAPIVQNQIPESEVLEDNLFEFKISSNAFIELDENDEISGYTATLETGSELPEWLSFNSETLMFTGQAANEHVGTIVIELGASDRMGAMGYQQFNLTVINTNDAPTVENEIPDMETNTTELYTYEIPENTFIDIDLGDELTYTAQLQDGSLLPEWLSFNMETNTFSGVPNNSEIFDIEVIATDIAGEKVSDNFKLTVNGAISISDISDNKINVYPNPTNGIITIDLSALKNSKGDAEGVVITDVNGKVIYINNNVINAYSSLITVDLSSQPAGIYFIRITNGFQTVLKKIVKQ